MSNVFTIKRGDTGPTLEVTLKDAAGNAVDITGNLGVQFQMKERQHKDNDQVALKVDAAATVVDAANGIVSYSWSSSDTDEIGEYVAEWVVTATNGSERTFPTPGFTTVRVVGDIE
jgi:hypothetical protein